MFFLFLLLISFFQKPPAAADNAVDNSKSGKESKSIIELRAATDSSEFSLTRGMSRHSSLFAVEKRDYTSFRPVELFDRSLPSFSSFANNGFGCCSRKSGDGVSLFR